ncbi:MAG: hypothetical protein WC556_09935 [Candidatus Methanoperedens sp.]
MRKTNRGGRNHITSGAYSENLEDVFRYWEVHNPGTAAHVEEIITKYLRGLKWNADHPRYIEVRDLAIRTVSRGILFMKILEDDYTRKVKAPVTGVFIKERPADQFTRLEEIDQEIQSRIAKLGLLFNN